MQVVHQATTLPSPQPLGRNTPYYTGKPVFILYASKALLLLIAAGHKAISRKFVLLILYSNDNCSNHDNVTAHAVYEKCKNSFPQSATRYHNLRSKPKFAISQVILIKGIPGTTWHGTYFKLKETTSSIFNVGGSQDTSSLRPTNPDTKIRGDTYPKQPV